MSAHLKQMTRVLWWWNTVTLWQEVPAGSCGHFLLHPLPHNSNFNLPNTSGTKGIRHADGFSRLVHKRRDDTLDDRNRRQVEINHVQKSTQWSGGAKVHVGVSCLRGGAALVVKIEKKASWVTPQRTTRLCSEKVASCFFQLVTVLVITALASSSLTFCLTFSFTSHSQKNCGSTHWPFPTYSIFALKKAARN